MMGRSGFELVVGAQGVEVLRLPLARGVHPIGDGVRGLRLGDLSGTLCVERDGVSFRDQNGGESLLSDNPATLGGVELHVEQRAHCDATATHEEHRELEACDAMRVVELPFERELARIQKGEVSVGTDPSCRVRLASLHVSRVHCWLFRRDRRLLVRDAGSKNGTFVNGVRITEHALTVPAHIRVGDVELRLEREPVAASLENVPSYIVGQSVPVSALLQQNPRFPPAESFGASRRQQRHGQKASSGGPSRSARRGGFKRFSPVNVRALGSNLLRREVLRPRGGGNFGGEENPPLAVFSPPRGGLFFKKYGEFPSP